MAKPKPLYETYRYFATIPKNRRKDLDKIVDKMRKEETYKALAKEIEK